MTGFDPDAWADETYRRWLDAIAKRFRLRHLWLIPVIVAALGIYWWVIRP